MSPSDPPPAPDAPAAPAPGPATPAHYQLHPWSWLFVLLRHVRQMIVPLLALVIFGGRDGGHDRADLLGGLIVIMVLVGASIAQFLTYRYSIGADAISIRSGFLHRSRREIPFARIHNVALHQNLLHRLFGVAEVRLESAGGHRPEAHMRVLRLDRALALEQLIRLRGYAPDAASAAPHAAAAHAPATGGQLLLALSNAEIVRLGLVSGRSLLALLAAMGALYQAFPERVVANFIEHWGRRATGVAAHLHIGWTTGLVAMASALLLAFVLLKAASVVLALLQYHGFRLTEDARRLTVERGLLARLRTSVAPRRIQAWTLQETVSQRVFQRRRLHIDTAVGHLHGEQGRALRELAPIITPARCDALIGHVLPQVAWPPAQWTAVPAGGWWRLCLWPLLWCALLAAALGMLAGPWALLVLLWLPWSAFKARRQLQRTAYSIGPDLVAVRSGWWTRWWRFAEVDKLQALRLGRSPLDRLCGTASLRLDTAGAHGHGPALRLRFLPEATAQALLDQLAAALARRRLRW